MDIVGVSNIVPGPNSVEIVMHCGKGKGGLVVAGLAYILPATPDLLSLWILYTRFGQLPRVQNFLLVSGRLRLPLLSVLFSGWQIPL